jgi:Spy/CpxP family protein refolding chaperone
MTPFSQWKIIGYAAAIFATGGISGGALGVYQTKSHQFEPQRQQEIGERMLNHFQVKLNLTPDQASRIKPIVEATATDINAIRADTAQRVNKTIEDSYTEISAILTPDQRTVLGRMESERETALRGRWQEGGRRRGGPGDSPDDGQSRHFGPGPGQ